MTTAARPTFEPARGGSSRGEKDLSAISKQYSSRDLPAHQRLKQREPGQGTTDELHGRDFRRELEERERTLRSGSDKRGSGSSSSSSRSKQPRELPAPPPLPASTLDADDPADDSDSADDSDDDEAELMAELQRIKKERAADSIRRDAERQADEERIRTENILSGNPLLSYSSTAARADASVKRRWDDDVVFKNCARSEPQRKQSRFINDAIRNDFHKKFMEKYVK